MLTDNQKDLMRLMVATKHLTDVQMKALAEKSDDDALAELNTWLTAAKANPNTTMGVYNKIIALGG